MEHKAEMISFHLRLVWPQIISTRSLRVPFKGCPCNRTRLSRLVYTYMLLLLHVSLIGIFEVDLKILDSAEVEHYNVLCVYIQISTTEVNLSLNTVAYCK